MAQHKDSPGGGPPPRSFREKGLDYFTQALGPPTEIPVDNGTIYRWKLPRKGTHDVNVYITIDAPELPDIAHIMISDPAKGADEPIKGFTVRNESEFPNVLAYIRARIEG
ncbi:MAG TPA: hypothetical protein VD997_05105 [Phycisphaerales bacterium]|nr:hypothetical protein [Phycisphaerales bacterium]